MLAELLWDGGELPDVETLKTMPLVHEDPVDATRTGGRHGSQYEGPSRTSGGSTAPSRGPRAFKHHGEVVAKGVLRPDAGDQTRGFAAARR